MNEDGNQSFKESSSMLEYNGKMLEQDKLTK